ncbi:MAG TPA: S8 family serine peptidase [Pyrinomonadaceae bacterium]|nr:S8 family serine peptidase [Pyrinomonadaceae bacterium]
MKRLKVRITLLSLTGFSVIALCVATLPSAVGGWSLINTSAAQTQSWEDKVDPKVLSAASTGQAEFLIYLNSQADLSGAQSLSTKEEKGQFVYDRLTATALATQPAVQHTLDLFGATSQSFWVTNAIWAKGNLAVVQAVAVRPEVAYIYASGSGRLEVPPANEPLSSSDSTSTSTLLAADPNPEANLINVNADDVWATGVLGQGAVVAGSDTGVRWDHAALKNQYRGWNSGAGQADHNYNWHDGTGTPCETTIGREPCDDHDHGTHTVGTMVGDDGASNRIGMAPGAKWIACRNMVQGAGVIPTYLDCMQWFIAPTNLDNQNPNPAKAPHVINNSWGCVEGCPPPALQDTLRASRAAGIFYAVSAGNDGSSPLGVINSGQVICNSIFAPLARYPEAFTVGSTDHRTDKISYFSSRGSVLGDPTAPLGLVKPNISAPGSGIRSSVRDGSYASFSGTSMAGPHVAGLVALLISANPRLAGMIDRLEDIIEQTAVRKTTTEACGGDSPTAVPNNTYGWGRIDALAAVLDALAPTAANDTAVTAEGIAVTINVIANDTDPDGDQLTVTSVGPAAHGSVVNNGNGTLTYTPAAGYVGIDTFTYTICAPEGCLVSSSTGAVTVTVQKGKGKRR